LNPALIIRLCYARGGNEVARRWRFDWFREQVLPRILRQDAALDLWLWINPADRTEIEAMSPRIRTFTVASGASPLDSQHPWSKVRGLPRYGVQFRIDSDDLIGPQFVSTALRTLDDVAGRRALVYFQPYKLDVARGDVYAAKPYRDDRPSPFLALRQPVDVPGADYIWVYSRGHTKLWRLVDAVRAIPEGHCWQTVHQFNASTAIGADRLIRHTSLEAIA
jgi:hypothetical protein